MAAASPREYLCCRVQSMLGMIDGSIWSIWELITFVRLRRLYRCCGDGSSSSSWVMKAGVALGSSSLGVGLFEVASTKIGCDGLLTMISGWESIIIVSVGTIGVSMVGDCAGSVASGGEGCGSGVKFPAMSARRCWMAASSLGAAGFPLQLS